MRTILYVASLGAAALLMAGCATTPPAPDAPSGTTGETAATVEATRPDADTAGTGTTMPAAALELAMERRGRERWDYIFGGEFDKAYDFLSPAYRDRLTRTEYIVKLAGQRVRWKAAEFKEAECEAELCMVTWIVTWIYMVPIRGVGTYEGETRFVERWIEAGGEWYFVPTV